MIPVDQEIVCKDKGDCQRAVIASLLDFELDMVPHFRLFPDDVWFNVYLGFMYGCGYDYEGCQRPHKERGLLLEDSINGYFEANVLSKTLPGCTHAVVMNMAGKVVHDPNPNKKWQGINILESGELRSWAIWSKVVPNEL